MDDESGYQIQGGVEVSGFGETDKHSQMAVEIGQQKKMVENNGSQFLLFDENHAK
jgi:hypothetical protein